MNKVRYCICGFGNQGSYYAKLIKEKQIPNAVVAAIVDINDFKLNVAKEGLFKGDKTVKYYNDYNKALKDKAFDVMVVTVPHYFHPQIVIDSLKAGVNALCDKPAGVYTKQVKEMNKVADKSKKLFGMMFNQRTNCVYRKMKEIIAKGGIGELQRVNWIITDWYRTQQYYDSGSWRASWKGEGGGVLINQCPHQIDLVSWVIGEQPKTVYGHCKYGRWHNVEVEDEVTAYFEYKNGATGVFITTTGEAPGTNRFEVSGTKGKLLCENNKLFYYKNEIPTSKHIKIAKTGFEKPKCVIEEPKTDGENLQHIRILRNFTNAVLKKEKLFVKGQEGINGVELMNAIELSGWKKGAPVTIPVNQEEYYKELMKRVKTSKLKSSNDNYIAGSLNFGTGQDKIKNKQK